MNSVVRRVAPPVLLALVATGLAAAPTDAAPTSVARAVTLAQGSAFFLAGHLANRGLPMPVIFDRYESFMYQQWLRVYMRSQMIKHNKDLLQVVDDTEGLLAKLHIY